MVILRMFFFLTCCLTVSCLYSQSPYRDVSFGNNGVAEIFLPEAGFCAEIITLTDGSLILVGNNSLNNQQVSFIKLKVNGDIDSSYGINGVGLAGLNDPMSESVDKCKLLPDGSIVCVGSVIDNSSTLPGKGIVIKMTPNGLPDSTFDLDGIREFSLPGSTEVSLRGIDVDSDQNIYVAGLQYNSPNYQPLIYKIDTLGVIDPAFAPMILSSYSKALFNDIVVDDGEIFVLGYDDVNFKMIAHQFFPNGAENSFFSNNFANTLSPNMDGQLANRLHFFDHSLYVTSWFGGATQLCNLTKVSVSGNIDTSYGIDGSFTCPGTGLSVGGNAEWIGNNSYYITYQYNRIKIFGAYPGGVADNGWCASGVLTDSVPAYDFWSDGAFNTTFDNKLIVALSTDSSITGSLVSVIRYSPSLIGIEKEEQEITVFPNPCLNEIFLPGIDSGEYTITNAYGSVQLKGDFYSKINVSTLSPGVYFLRVVKDKETYGVKFLKQ